MSKMAKQTAVAIETKTSKKSNESELPDGVTAKQLLALSKEMNKVMDLEPALDEESVDIDAIKQEASEIRPEDFIAGRTDSEGEDIPYFSDKAKATLKVIGITLPEDEDEEDEEDAKPKAKAKAKAKDEDEDEDEEDAKPKAKAKAKDDRDAKPKAKAKSDKAEKLVDIARSLIGKSQSEWMKRFKVYYQKEAVRICSDEHITERVRSYIAVLGNGGK